MAERNAQLALAANAARIGCYANNLETGVVTVSEGYTAIHGLPEGTVQTTLSQWRTRVHPDDLAPFDELREQIFGNRRHDYTFDYRIIRADVGVRWIESRGCVSYDEDGQPQQCIGINIDVTERKQTEARLSDALAVGRVVAFEWDTVTCRSQRSDNAERILGIMQGGDFLRQVHPADRGNFTAFIRNLSPRNPWYTLTFRFARSDSSIVWLEEEAKGEFDTAGKLLRIRGLTRDVTERKNAELALAERNMQFDLAEKAALVGSYAYDLDAKVVRVSEGYAALHGLPEGTAITTGNEWRARTHPEDLIRIETVWNQAFRGHRGEYDIEYRIVRDGKVRWIYSRSFISYGSDGRAQRVVGVNIDITERKQAAENQRFLVAELDHRVKNVLATVSAVAAHTRDASNSMEHFVAALDGRIRSMASAHELLSCRRWQGIPLAELLQRELTPYARGNNTEVDGPEVLLRAEAGQTMAFVFHELTTNAAKYGALSTSGGRVTVRWYWPPSGGVRERLTIEWKETGGPAVAAPRKSGYGTSVIQELIPHELGGMADLTIAPEGVRCRMEIPGDWVERQAGPIDAQSPLVTRAGNGFDPLGAGSTDPRSKQA